MMKTFLKTKTWGVSSQTRQNSPGLWHALAKNLTLTSLSSSNGNRGKKTLSTINLWLTLFANPQIAKKTLPAGLFIPQLTKTLPKPADREGQEFWPRCQLTRRMADTAVANKLWLIFSNAHTNLEMQESRMVNFFDELYELEEKSTKLDDC